MRARLRGPGGASTITLQDDATIGDLISQIIEKTSISSFDIKYGYPPQPLLLEQHEKSLPLSKLGVKLDGEQLTISARLDDAPKETNKAEPSKQPSEASANKASKPSESSQGFSFTGLSTSPQKTEKKEKKQVSLQRKAMAGDVPELPLLERGATLVLRVMPDDNSCLFRAFGTAVLPGDDLTMTELRSLVAGAIQADPETYSQVVLEQKPDDYCRWIQTPDAWGGFIEMGILAKHFDIEICSIDVQTLRVDKFNEGAATRCILVYSGIHYDTIVQSPSEPPHTTATNPPDFDVRIFDQDDHYILTKALELCKKLQAKHYYTDTGGMAIKCNICGVVVYGEGQAAGHAGQTGHYDMAEVQTFGGE
ncbi:probable OTU1 Yeast OTU Deubiquitinating enzyme 1 [Phialocephala subalpina]|uniref:Ubiquitin thioesterase OTU n=1 Tax=Phialocephala subalpina TaxID=576137 RepID=A0A1L7WXJ7_9HELO|nr:probable OTU1 Yeast OTU Deubiquitinating enzyme 1 [Phialocephala subalpina]